MGSPSNSSRSVFARAYCTSKTEPGISKIKDIGVRVLRGTTTEAKYYAEGEATRLIEDCVLTVDFGVHFELVNLSHPGH